MAGPRDVANKDTVGTSEACAYNDHEQCRAARCRCTCHTGQVAEALAPVIAQVATAPVSGAEKVCPKCGIKRPTHEAYCRIDGERLSSLLCGTCGAGGEPGDAFCWKCGSPAGSDKPAVVNDLADDHRGDSGAASAEDATATEAETLAQLQKVWAGTPDDRPDQVVVAAKPAAAPKAYMRESSAPKGPRIRVPFMPPK